MEELKRTFAIRLRRYAERLDSIKAALERVEDIEDDDYSPSRYTPSRNRSRVNLADTCQRIGGYCIAVDDALNLDHCTTENRFYSASSQGLHKLEEYEDVDHDAGMSTAAHDEAASRANTVFTDALFG